MLLELPPELTQLVFQHCTTPTFMQLALSCHVLFEIASTCREVILHHLQRTPGLELDVASLSTEALFRLLAKRSCQQLYGAEFHASRKLFYSEEHTIDALASSFGSVDDSTLALVFKDDERVHVCDAQNENIVPRRQLRSPWEKPGMVVLKSALDADNNVHTLQRFSYGQDDLDTEHPFVKHALQSGSSRVTYLAQYTEPPHYRARLCAFPDHADYEPLGLAAANEDTFAISWQHAQNNHNEVVLYTVLQESVDDTSGLISSYHFLLSTCYYLQFIGLLKPLRYRL